MRIISGKFKGRIIKVPRTFKGRPTTDFAREGFFNVVKNYVDFERIKVLELFAGTGAFSIEFMSRGALEVVSVDIAPLHVNFINSVYRQFECKNARAIKADAFRFIGQCKDQYDVIFADPPYDLPDLTVLPDLVIQHKLLKEGGLFVLEHGERIKFENHSHFEHQRKYGSVNYSFFRAE